MGNGASQPSKRAPAGASGTPAEKPSPGPRPEFRVWAPSGAPGGSPLPTILRLEDEVLLLLDPDTGAQVYQVYYFRIVCWGFSRTSFHWRTFAGEEEGEPAPVPAEAAAAAAAAAAVSVFSVTTEEGVAIERALMASVRRLMGRMESRGVGAPAFAALLDCLRSLAADGLTDHALTAVKQMALGRSFDARQATELVNTLGALSPFEKIEGACALYPGALLHPASLPTLLLDCFEDAMDRENVCHRLGIVVSQEGAISEAPTASSRGLRR